MIGDIVFLSIVVCTPSSTKLQIFHVCIACTYCMCMVQKLTARKGIHMTERLGNMASVFFLFFVLSRVTHVPFLEQMYRNVLCLSFFLRCGMILKLSQIMKYEWDVNYLSKHNKNIMPHRTLL